MHVNDEAVCVICLKYICPTEQSIKCNSKCNRFFHRICVGIDGKDYPVLVKTKKWCCNRIDCGTAHQCIGTVSTGATRTCSNTGSNTVNSLDAITTAIRPQLTDDLLSKVNELMREQNNLKILLTYMFSSVQGIKKVLQSAENNRNSCRASQLLHPALQGEEKEKALIPLIACGWKVAHNRDALQKEFVFKNFSEAFLFLARAALLAEKMSHHPEWFNKYNKVEVTLISRDVSSITKRDTSMAPFLDNIAEVISQLKIQ